jgi:hypothetical protein
MRRLIVILTVLLVAAVGSYVYLGTDRTDAPSQPPEPADARSGYAPGTLPGGTSKAVEVAVEALPLALSYDYRSLDKGLEKATALMTEDFASEFSRTFEQTAATLARDQEAVTSATVRAAGAVRVEGERVLCLVYVDQVLASSTTVTDRDKPVRVSQNRVLVGVTDDSGQWRVDSIQPL